MNHLKTQNHKTSAETSIRRTLFVGVTLVVLMAGGAGGIAASTGMAGAVIAQGSFVVDSHIKKIQHQTGGTVAAVGVRDGERVKAGQLLVSLDETQTKANLEIVLKKLDEMSARRVRLEAERDERDAISFPQELTGRASDPAVAALLESEKRNFALRVAARNGQKAQLEERAGQLREEKDGLVVQKAAKEEEIEIMKRELEGVRSLWSKNLVTLQRVTTVERDSARFKGEYGQIVAGIAQSAGKTTETRLQIIQVDQDARKDVAKELSEIDAQTREFMERKVSGEYQLRNMVIRAPQDGIVHELSVHTAGGVVTPGEQIMQIVPVGDALRVLARIAPQDIDQVNVGQTAIVRLSAFNQRVTPELDGTVEEISADLSTDQKTGVQFYTTRLRISAHEMSRLGALKVIPGMPAEAFIQTSSRTMLSYLVKPLSDQIARSFRED